MKQDRFNIKILEKSQSANNFPSDKCEKNYYLAMSIASFDICVKTNTEVIE